MKNISILTLYTPLDVLTSNSDISFKMKRINFTKWNRATKWQITIPKIKIIVLFCICYVYQMWPYSFLCICGVADCRSFRSNLLKCWFRWCACEDIFPKGTTYPSRSHLLCLWLYVNPFVAALDDNVSNQFTAHES